MLSLQFHVLLACTSAVLAYKPTPLLGPVFEAPTGLQNSTVFRNALQDLQQTLDNTTKTGTTPYGAWPITNNSFSIQVFSATSDELFSYHYSSPALEHSKEGATHVNANSIYRIGSVSKLITVYLFLIEVGPKYWSHSITEFVPELEVAARECSALSNPIGCVDWTDITLGAIASQMAGIARNYATQAELLDPLSGVGPETAVKIGLPPLPASDLEPCGLGAKDPCPEKAFLHGYSAEAPVFAPFTTPIYSDGSYELIEFALENITGRSFPDMIQNDLFARLNMTGSSYYAPKDLDNVAFGPGLEGLEGVEAELGNETPVGGYFSTVADLSRLGRSILASTLLKPTVTRQWMKPVTFAAGPISAVGLPWEIFQVTDLTDHVIDLYTKSGDVFDYASYFILSPDYNVGFIVLAAGNDTTELTELLADVVTEAIFPALETATRQQAQATYAGTYKSTEKGVDSEIILTTQPGKPGLKVEKWLSNGTDTLAVLYESSEIDIRMYPTNLVQQISSTSTRVAYRALVGYLSPPQASGVVSQDLATWQDIDGIVYGNVGLDEYVFEVVNGKAVSLTPKALRITLRKST